MKRLHMGYSEAYSRHDPEVHKYPCGLTYGMSVKIDLVRPSLVLAWSGPVCGFLSLSLLSGRVCDWVYVPKPNPKLKA